MSAVVGIDLSSKALDLVKLDEDSNRAEWVRCELEGKTAWERTLGLRDALLNGLPSQLITPEPDLFTSGRSPCFANCGKPACNDHGCMHVYQSPPYATSWWDDVYLVAIEAPYGRGQAGTNAVLNRVVGAVAASLPARLRDPARCWLVTPTEWKAGLGLKGKPSDHDLRRIAPKSHIAIPIGSWDDAARQNARDAYCIALYSRDLNTKGVAAA